MKTEISDNLYFSTANILRYLHDNKKISFDDVVLTSDIFSTTKMNNWNDIKCNIYHEFNDLSTLTINTNDRTMRIA